MIELISAQLLHLHLHLILVLVLVLVWFPLILQQQDQINTANPQKLPQLDEPIEIAANDGARYGGISSKDLGAMRKTSD